MRHWQHIIEACTQHIEGDQGTPDGRAYSWFLIGCARYWLGQYVEASAALEESFRLNPRHDYGFIAYARALDAVGRLDDAIMAYRSAINCRSYNMTAWFQELQEYGRRYGLIITWVNRGPGYIRIQRGA